MENDFPQISSSCGASVGRGAVTVSPAAPPLPEKLSFGHN